MKELKEQRDRWLAEVGTAVSGAAHIFLGEQSDLEMVLAQGHD